MEIVYRSLRKGSLCIFFFTFVFFIINKGIIIAQSSTNYWIKKSVVDMAGSGSLSPNYLLVDAGGQPSAVGVVGSMNYNASIGFFGGIGFDTGVIEEVETAMPSDFKLFQNYPNPFNPTTTIRFLLPKPSHVTLKIYNIFGQNIETIINEEWPAGNYEVVWNAERLTSGIYLCRLEAGKFVEMKKLILQK